MSLRALRDDLSDDQMRRHRFRDYLSRMSRAKIRRSEDDVGSLIWRQCSKPFAERDGLFLAQSRQWNVNIADSEVDGEITRGEGSFAGDIAG